MDVERTMEFILNQQARFEANQAKFEANQAKFEANFAKADQRFLKAEKRLDRVERVVAQLASASLRFRNEIRRSQIETRSEEHTSELQSRENLVCRLLLEKKKKKKTNNNTEIISDSV